MHGVDSLLDTMRKKKNELVVLCFLQSQICQSKNPIAFMLGCEKIDERDTVQTLHAPSMSQQQR